MISHYKKLAAFLIPIRHWAASVKNQVLCFEKAALLFERSEFNDAETKTANFWQRSRPCRDFSLVRFFWSSKEMNEKRSNKEKIFDLKIAGVQNYLHNNQPINRSTDQPINQ